MKAVRLENPEQLAVIDWPEAAAPGPGEALVHVRRAGVCGTDHHSYRGRQPFFAYPRILGHELSVEVADTGERCALAPYLFCGRCMACRRGRTNCCAHLKVLGVHVDGGMRERIVVPRVNLHPSSALSFDELALVEPLAIGAHAVARAAIEPGEEALVIGAGPIGLAVVQAARAADARVIVSEMHDGRRAFARTRFDLAAAIAPGDDLRAVLRHRDELPTLVFDATGSLESMRGAFDYVGAGGRLVLVGLAQGDVSFHDPEFHRRELTLLATRNATGDDFRRVIGWLEAGRIDAASWITHRAVLDELPSVFERWMDPASGCLKAMVEVS
jgi:2-desacetyl-2-hydroxyethyl bacteriochlorophyllide A dehydrogenase